jgi:xanthine dehydrogenase accessory factor
MEWIKTLHSLAQTESIFAIATISDVGGSAPREVGAKIIVLSTGEFYHTIGGGELERQVIEQSKECIDKKKNGLFSYPLGAKTGQCCGGVVEVFIDVIENKNPNLFIFGQGHVGLAISKALEDAPINLYGVDSRHEWLEKAQQYNQKTIKFNSCKSLDIPSQSSCVVLTHSHDLDFDIVNHLCQRSDLKYIGLIGSQSKWLRFQKRLKNAGRTDDQVSRITCPIGIPVGGKTPAEIAISFGAELLGKLNASN